MYDTRYRSAAAVADIGSSTRDCSGCRDSSEQSGEDISKSLTNQFGVGFVVVANHTVRDNSGQQRFNSGKDCDGKCRRNHFLNQLHGDMRKLEGREGGRKLSVDTSDGIDRQLGKIDKRSSYNDCNERAGNFIRYLWPQNHDQKRECADSGSHPVNCIKMFCIGNEFFQKSGRGGFQTDFKEIL